MIAFFGVLVRSKVAWGVVLGLVLVGVVYGNWVRPWLAARDLGLQQARQEIADQAKATNAALAEYQKAQKDIASLTAQYNAQKAIAEKAKAEAAKQALAVQQWRDEAARLGTQVAKLEADRKALPAITSRTQAVQELRRLGY